LEIKTVRPPSDCLNANDAQITVASPELLINENYQIKIINESWEAFYYEEVIDTDHSFLLDSLTPGEYQLVEVTPENSRCGFEWQNERIIIDPPNEQLQVAVDSNSPVCEGATLELNATVIPGGSVTWRGPNAFISSDVNTIVDSVEAVLTGSFEMIANYGYCLQERALEVLIPTAINAAISGKKKYCERAFIELYAEGAGELKAFDWSGPEGMIRANQTLYAEGMTTEKEGWYQVIINNGYCKDTAMTFLEMLPSPTIGLPEIIETDFCIPEKLAATIAGDTEVTYTWEPSIGLDCSDCLNPELLIPFEPGYQLTVINEELCADTASIQVKLSEDKLIYVPNAFSPNQDGVNDYFQMFPGCGVVKIKNLRIFNRWGAKVYSKNNIDHFDHKEFWNGFTNSKVNSEGVYIWKVEIELVDGTTKQLFGDVSLLR